MPKVLSYAAACLLAACATTHLDAQETADSFLSRLNPFRHFSRHENTGQPSLDDLRVRLEQRGVPAEQVEARIQEIATARENGSQGNAGGRPSLDEIRARLQERGVDPALIEDRVARMADRDTAGRGQAGRHSAARVSALAGGAPPSLDELRSRLQERGLAEEQITERIERIEAARESRPQRTDGGGPDPDRVRSHLEQRGLDETQINARLERMPHRFGR